ncbi:hypothetical protein [Dyadobacter fanqingshengii]|uniref:Uncharacterized protein n=1 Tax=Dyadobacter fanqingshengii TaxID=2906443 RepID=A0A9X1PCR0_9BACT|nr:hypothetical protein [Dyadobacter fanqingshengii]MCF0040857.1 hypothetical protein [Dyadobacter fanqingshengii]MCF2506039.1 hypothetical protein [Dyadobacter fanqingshengii]USJ37410.1 hypothetical protein NFI81_06420 [Dyadobacter fanqingshengii]
MVYEKIFTMTTGKQVKMVVRAYYPLGQTTSEPFVEIWVKQGKQDLFFSPLALGLPRYGFETDGRKNMKDRAMQASGISDQQFEQVITEFKQITTSSVLL